MATLEKILEQNPLFKECEFTEQEDGSWTMTIEDTDLAVCWYDDDGNLHNDSGGPAWTGKRYTRWYQHGELHREDGPAEIGPDKRAKWYWQGKKIKFDDWLENAGIDCDGEEATLLRMSYK